MRLILLLCLLYSSLGWSSEIFYAPDSSGRELLRDLLAIAAPSETLLQQYSLEEDRVAKEIDDLLIESSEVIPRHRIAFIIDTFAENILLQFLTVAGEKAFERGQAREHYLARIRQFVAPKPFSCGAYLVPEGPPRRDH